MAENRVITVSEFPSLLRQYLPKIINECEVTIQCENGYCIMIREDPPFISITSDDDIFTVSNIIECFDKIMLLIQENSLELTSINCHDIRTGEDFDYCAIK